MRVLKNIPLIVFTIIFLGFSFDYSIAQLTENQAFLIEGSGFGVTEQSIHDSQINFLITTTDKVGSSTNIAIEDGFVSLGDGDFFATNLSGTVLRDGRFLRLIGTIEDTTGRDASFNVFGRLVLDSNEGTVYTFTGRLQQEGTSHKIIYTSKILGLSDVISTTIKEPTTSVAEQTQENEVVVHIRKGAYDPSSFNYITAGQPTMRGPYSLDRITIEPGTTITWVNDDTVSHSISSGTGLGSSTRASQGSVKICDESQLQTLGSGSSFRASDCTFTLDGRIKSGPIPPGQSWSFTVEEAGFYRLADIDYIHMTSTIYAFPIADADIIKRSSSNPQN